VAKKRLTEDEQRAIVAERLSNVGTDSELRSDRENAMNFYYGRPLGNEIEGRSQVVSKDLMDTVEWIMPSLMRIFCIEQAVQFDPVGPEDEQKAKQETGYVRHVLWKKNPGFMIIYEWIKSALLQKNGYVKYRWLEEQKVCFEEYSGLSEDELVETLETLKQRGDVKVVGQEEDDRGYFSIKVRIKKTYGCVKVECCPPEEIIVAKDCRANIKAAKFVGHLRKNVLRSELIEEGYSKARVAKLTSYDHKVDMGEQTARDSVGESQPGDDESVDKASSELELLDCWTYIDADGDGIAELRHYLLAGNDTLENEEAPEIPAESWTPTPVPFRHYGLSLFDLLEDLQRIKTALTRGLLDNTYFTNAQRYAYSRDVDVQSLQINRPGGHVLINVKGPIAGHIQPLTVQPIVDRILPVITYIDTVKETRVGVGRMTSGVDADVLAQSTKGAYTDAKSAANQRIEAIARIFAETGYASLFTSLHQLLRRHQDWVTRFKLRDQWVDVNPADWDERADLTVAVGLGNASKEEIRANLAAMGSAMAAAKATPGLVQPKNEFALLRRMQVELGFENEPFITDPQSEEFKQFTSQKPPPDPIIAGETIRANANLEGKKLDAQIKREGMAQERDLKITELELEAGTDLAKAGIGAEVAIARGNGAASQGGGVAPTEPLAPGGARGP
jgi:hypothetical protein